MVRVTKTLEELTSFLESRGQEVVIKSIAVCQEEPPFTLVNQYHYVALLLHLIAP